MSRTFTMRLNDETYAVLEAMATLSNVSMAEMARQCLREKLARITPDDDIVVSRRAELTRQLALLDELPFKL